jgi:hypothetical protein
MRPFARQAALLLDESVTIRLDSPGFVSWGICPLSSISTLPGRRSQLSAGRDESRRTLALARQPAARIGSASAPNIDVRVWNLRHARYIPPFASIGGVNGVARTSGFRTIRPVLVCTMPKKKSPAKKQRSPRSAATPACPCCLCGWVYVVNDGSGKPQVRRSCPAGVKVTQVQPGEYIVTFPTIKKVFAPVATLNNSVGTITAVPGDSSALAPNQVRVLTLSLGNALLGVYDFTVFVAC